MKKISIFLVILSLVSSFLTPAYAAETQPTVGIVGATIKDDDTYFELSLQVTPGSGGFSSAAAVIAVDYNYLIPVTWTGTAVPMTAASDWQNIAALPAVSPDEISARTALAYLDGTTVYIYMNAEAPTTLTTAPNDGKVMTLRFAYAGETDDAKAASKTAVINDFKNKTGAIVSLAPKEIAAASPVGESVYYRAGDTQYYYNTELSAIAASVAALADVESAEPLEIGTLMNTGLTLTAEEDVASQKATTSTADPAETPAPTDSPGTTDTTGFASIVFFDWDETTMLGSMVVSAYADDGVTPLESSQISALVDAYTKENLFPNETVSNAWAAAKEKDDAVEATDDNPLGLDTTNGITSVNLYDSCTADERAAYPLVSHNGYTFGKWMAFDDEAYTIYGTTTSSTDTTAWITLKEPADPDYQTALASGSLVLKAAYIANTKITSAITTGTKRYYTVKSDTDPSAGGFSRLSAQAYGVTLTVKRENANGAVFRMKQPALRITYTISGASSYMLYELTAADEQKVEVVGPNGATQFAAEIIDAAELGTDTWVSAAAYSSSLTVAQSDYSLYGMINYINEQSILSKNVTLKTYWTAAGINLGSGVSGTTASGYVREAQALKYAKQGTKYLSQTEMQYAVDSAGGWVSS